MDKGNITIVKEVSLRDKGVTGENLINKVLIVIYLKHNKAKIIIAI